MAAQVSGAVPQDGHTLTVFFTEEMLANATFTNPVSYTITPTLGASVTVNAIEAGTGNTSAILTHSGATLGGSYTVTVSGSIVNASSTPIDPAHRTATFLALADIVTMTAIVGSDNVSLLFSEDLLPETEVPGIENVASYGFAADYPFVPVVTKAVQVAGNEVSLTVVGMTDVAIATTVTPSTSIDFNGTSLPSEATTYSGEQIGDGTSTIVSGVLRLTKAQPDSLGWSFQDTQSFLTEDSSFRFDVTIGPSASTFTPSLGAAQAIYLYISDGNTNVSLALAKDIFGDDVIQIDAPPGYSNAVVADWSLAETKISWLRNQKAGFYALLVNDVPLLCVPISDITTPASMPPGIMFVLADTYAVNNFPLMGVQVTASQTVYSASWNFLHGVICTYLGSNTLTRSTLMTKRGPLVKNWGDATPATTQDVTVRVNGVPVTVTAVNPYLGLITLETPIPLTPPGMLSVEVDYAWLSNPVFGMRLNTPGNILNAWLQPQGWHPPAISPSPANSLGAMGDQRFPQSFVLEPVVAQRPIQIGYRYIGFETKYTATLNSPTTLLLNQNPHATSTGSLSKSLPDVSVSYYGEAKPDLVSVPWVLEGDDIGYVGTGDQSGYFFIEDVTGNPTLYSRDEDFSLPSMTNVAVRLQITDYVLDGVFTGVGFGVHNNKFLYFVGFIEVNHVKHIALLKDATRPYLLSSWEIGSAFDIRITSSNTFTTTSTIFANATGSHLVFQILDGPQAGVYTVADCGILFDGDTAIVTIEGSFPADYTRWGAQDAVAYLEVPWGTETTYRLVAQTNLGSAQVYVGGSLTGLSLSVNRVSAYPAQTVLLLPTTAQGAIFWGVPSRIAHSTSKWDFVRYGVAYDQATFHFQGIVVAAEMGVTPDLDANHEWFITEDFGYGDIVSSELLLKSTAASPNAILDTTFGYGRLEPFLNESVFVDLDATFRVDSGVLGAGDAQILIQNGRRSVLFSTILYVDGGTDPYRRLVEIPNVSITGIQNPTLDGWVVQGSGLEVDVLDLPLELVQVAGASQTFIQNLDTTSPDLTGGRIFEARITIVSFSGLGVAQGPIFGCAVGASFRDVAIQFTLSGLLYVTWNGSAWVAVGSSIPFTWTDGEPHTYRVIADPLTDSVTLVVDDVVLDNRALTLFSAHGVEGRCYFGAIGTSAYSTVEWHSYSVTGIPALIVKRTLGVYRSGPVTDIDSWEIPRTDSDSVPNSAVEAVIEEMDWTEDVQIRIRLDTGWGVTVFRPDIPPPPYYTGNYATQYTDPSAGWINIEYRDLPRLPVAQRFGKVAFGSLDPRSITQQRWVGVSYRIYTQEGEDFIAPQHMVLNWYNVVTSGELLNDTSVEVLEVESLTKTLISFKPTHINAARVFNVVVGGVVLGPSDWSFDASTQTITLATPLAQEHTLVTVSFAAGTPVTNTYLCSQPLSQSTTLLNEGTPPFPKSQIGGAIRTEVSVADPIYDPTDDTDPDSISNAYQTVVWVDNPDALYESLEFCEVTDGHSTGLIASINDGYGLDEGWVGMTMSGTMFSDATSLPGGPAVWKGSSGVQDTLGGFNQTNVLMVSGGGYTHGTLNNSILKPTSGNRFDQVSVIQSMTMHIRMFSVIIDATGPIIEVQLEEDFTGIVSDNGSCEVTVVDAASTTYSRVGPWGGPTALATRSLLGPGSTMFIVSGGASLGPLPTVTTFTLP